jgi:hypothetical protein
MGVTSLEFPVKPGNPVNTASGATPPAKLLAPAAQFWPSPEVDHPEGGNVPVEKSSEKIKLLEFSACFGFSLLMLLVSLGGACFLSCENAMKDDIKKRITMSVLMVDIFIKNSFNVWY